MTTSKPKVLLFDIGGVCVVSPFQAILDYEKAHDIPVGYVNYSISYSKPNGSWHKLERGEVLLNDAWFESWKKDIQNPDAWRDYHHKKLNWPASKPLPSLPQLDPAELYWGLMGMSRENDRHMAPALWKLRATGKWKLAALSNTAIFPLGHPFNEPHPNDIRNVFDIFISSAHVGMRKPDRNIYDYTMKTLQDKWPDANIMPKDVVFFDDIGENLRMGKQTGWQTVKVWLGKTDDAVRELERLTGENLLDKNKDKARLHKFPRFTLWLYNKKTKSKLDMIHGNGGARDNSDPKQKRSAESVRVVNFPTTRRSTKIELEIDLRQQRSDNPQDSQTSTEPPLSSLEGRVTPDDPYAGHSSRNVASTLGTPEPRIVNQVTKAQSDRTILLCSDPYGNDYRDRLEQTILDVYRERLREYACMAAESMPTTSLSTSDDVSVSIAEQQQQEEQEEDWEESSVPDDDESDYSEERPRRRHNRKTRNKGSSFAK